MNEEFKEKFIIELHTKSLEVLQDCGDSEHNRKVMLKTLFFELMKITKKSNMSEILKPIIMEVFTEFVKRKYSSQKEDLDKLLILA